LLDRVSLYLPFIVDEADKWREWVKALSQNLASIDTQIIQC